jgi:hypothetical protein
MESRVFQVSRPAQFCVTPRTVLGPSLSRFVRGHEHGVEAPKYPLRSSELRSVQLRSVEVRSVLASHADVIPQTDVITKKIENLPRCVALSWEGSVKNVLQGVFKTMKRAAESKKFQRLQERLAKISSRHVRPSSSVQCSSVKPGQSVLRSLRTVVSPVASVASSGKPGGQFQSVASKPAVARSGQRRVSLECIVPSSSRLH